MGNKLTGSAICNSAFKYAGIQYFEGNPQNTKNGFDCSGIVQQALSDLGMSIPRTTAEQLAAAGSRNIGTDIKKCQQGDVLHYVGHEEIYLTPTQVFSEATTGTVASVRGKTNWPIIGIVRYADAGPGEKIDIAAADFSNYKGHTTVPQGNDPGKVSGQLTDVVPGLDSVTSAIGSIIGVLGSMVKLFSFVLDPKNWWRVALALFGTILLLVALMKLTKTPTTAVIQGSSGAAQTARKIADMAGEVPVE